MNNLFESLPVDLDGEAFDGLLRHEHIRIERIVSRGHTSPDRGWYDQDENEWVVVLQGSGVVTFDDGTEMRLKAGDYVDIPAHSRHKVSWTDPSMVTIWLAVFYM